MMSDPQPILVCEGQSVSKIDNMFNLFVLAAACFIQKQKHLYRGFCGNLKLQVSVTFLP